MTDLVKLTSRIARFAYLRDARLQGNARRIDRDDLSGDTAIKQEIAETILPRCLIFSNDRGEELEVQAQNGASDAKDDAIATFSADAKWIAVTSGVSAEKPGRIAAFLQNFAGAQFDAVHLKGKVVLGSYGSPDDLVTLAMQLGAQASDETSAFACNATHDLDQFLFCGTTVGEVLVFRTRAVALNDLLRKWQVNPH